MAVPLLDVAAQNLALEAELQDAFTRVLHSGRDILGDEVLDFFGRYRVEYGIFGVAGVAEDGSLLEFHSAEVRTRERIRENAQVSLLVLDRSKFGRLAPALGETISDVDYVILDQRPDARFDHMLDNLGDRLLLAERDQQ